MKEQVNSLFIAMAFLLLAVNASYAVAWLAFQTSLFAIPLALLASIFWDQAIFHAFRKTNHHNQ